MEHLSAMLDPTPQNQIYQPQSLPAQMTSLIGREEEITAVSTLCQRADIRLLTLTGPGGSGKTRLALAVATKLLPEFSDGVFFASLAPLREANLVLSSIAQALFIEEGTGQPLAQQLQAALQKRHLLLVLDNFEQVLPLVHWSPIFLPLLPMLKLLPPAGRYYTSMESTSSS